MRPAPALRRWQCCQRSRGGITVALHGNIAEMDDLWRRGLSTAVANLGVG